MPTQKQRQTSKRNVKKAQAGARRKKTITKLSSKTRSALGREGAKAAALAASLRSASDCRLRARAIAGLGLTRSG